jgi:hypothetical protein
MIILGLQYGRYYIDLTNDPDTAIQNYLCNNKSGNFWTQYYKPIEIINITMLDDNNPFLVDSYLKMYMAQYGIDNVRGGYYNSFIMTDREKAQLEREIAYYSKKIDKMDKERDKRLEWAQCINQLN